MRKHLLPSGFGHIGWQVSNGNGLGLAIGILDGLIRYLLNNLVIPCQEPKPRRVGGPSWHILIFGHGLHARALIADGPECVPIILPSTAVIRIIADNIYVLISRIPVRLGIVICSGIHPNQIM